MALAQNIQSSPGTHRRVFLNILFTPPVQDHNPDLTPVLRVDHGKQPTTRGRRRGMSHLHG